MKAKIVWECTKCKKENEDNNFNIDIVWGRCNDIDEIYIPLQCTTCGNIDEQMTHL